MAAELPRPGVEVIQEFRAVSPSVVTPTLVPCVVGACKQVVEVLSGRALNDGAKVSLAPFFTAKDAALSGTRYVYSGLGGKKLVLSVNHSPSVEVLFSGNSLTPGAVAEAVNTALNDAGVFGAVAETAPELVDGALVEKTWTLRTVAKGSLQVVEVLSTTDAEVWAAFGLKPGWVFSGRDMYDGYWWETPLPSFPDPRNNLRDLVIDPDSVRVFLASTASNMRELQRKQAFCRRGGTVYAYDDGNGDALTSFVDAPTENFLSTATGAVIVGSVAPTVPGTLVGKTLTLRGNHGEQTYTIVNNATWPLTSLDGLIAQLNAFFSDFVFDKSSSKLRITTVDLGQDALLEVVGGTAIAELGLAATHIGSVSVVATRATGTLTGTLNFSNAETVTIGTVTYTFRSPFVDAANNIAVGANLEGSLANLKAAINHETGEGTLYGTGTAAHPTVTCTTAAATTLTVQAITSGTGGNSIATTETAANASWGAATLTGGTGTVGYPTAFSGKNIILNGGTYAFTMGHPTDSADLLALLAAAFPTLEFGLDGSNRLTVRQTSDDPLVVGGGTSNGVLGLTAGTYTGPVPTAGGAFPVQAGDELFIEGKSFGTINMVAPGAVTTRLKLSKQAAMSTPVTVTGSVNLAELSYPAAFHTPDKDLTIDGVTYTFAAGAPASQAELLSILNAQFPGYTFTALADGAAYYLKVTKVSSGPLAISGTACTVLGIPTGTHLPVLGSNFYIIARNLTGSAGRPVPELTISGVSPILAPWLLRNIDGAPLRTSRMYVYMMYKALRRDVTPAADKPGLLVFDTTTDLNNAIGPITNENPLALGLYLAMLNAPGAQVTGLGVDEVSDDMPDGTVESFTRAAEFLEGVEVYAIAPLTHDRTVAEIYSTHVSTMSLPENRGERICLFNTKLSTHQLDTLVASGVGNSTGAASFDTGVANLSELLLAAGIPNPIGTIDARYGVFIDIASDNKHYSVQSVAGSVVTIRLTFAGGENDDGFYAESPSTFPPGGTPLIDETFAIKVRGAELKLPTGKPDKGSIALTTQQYAQTFKNRRFWHIVPDACAATIEGIEQRIEGYYMCAAYAGLVAGQPPQQSFTNFPLTGFTRVFGSNDTFSERQLNVMAAGGNWIVVQDTPVSPLTARAALTTDMTSIETRTDSITKVVDFTAKVLRRGYRNFIGRFNITQGFLDSLGYVGQGLLTFLTDSGVLIGGSINNIIQDETNPDTVLVDVTLDVPVPCNYIRLTLVI